MSEDETLTFSKKERVCSKLLIDRLFSHGGSSSMSVYPLRLVFQQMERNEGEPSVMLLVSVPKRCFKRAVKRNRVKRQVREVYRRNKHILSQVMDGRETKKLVMALIWLDDQLHETSDVERCVGLLMQRVVEKI